MARTREATRSEDIAEVSKRLEPYLAGLAHDDVGHDARIALDEDLQRAMTLVTVMPPHQQRATIERLACPDDPERARRAVDALLERALVAEDDRGCLRLT